MIKKNILCIHKIYDIFHIIHCIKALLLKHYLLNVLSTKITYILRINNNNLE